MALCKIGACLFAPHLLDKPGEADVFVFEMPQRCRLRHFQRRGDIGKFHVANCKVGADFAGQPILERKLRRLCDACQACAQKREQLRIGAGHRTVELIVAKHQPVAAAAEEDRRMKRMFMFVRRLRRSMFQMHFFRCPGAAKTMAEDVGEHAHR